MAFSEETAVPKKFTLLYYDHRDHQQSLTKFNPVSVKVKKSDVFFVSLVGNYLEIFIRLKAALGSVNIQIS